MGIRTLQSLYLEDLLCSAMLVNCLPFYASCDRNGNTRRPCAAIACFENGLPGRVPIVPDRKSRSTIIP